MNPPEAARSDAHVDPAPGAERAISGGAYHWRSYGIDDFLPPAESGNRVLLLGCGDAGERPFLRDRGFESIGVDIKASSGADIVADAHELPLRSSAFDIVLSMQVLEHLHSPWIAVQEIARVLRPGGRFIGSVAFLKPYHKSYFHMTHQGVRQLLSTAGLSVERLAGAQSVTYSIYGGMLPIGGRPFRRALFGAVDRMLRALRVGVWSLTRRLDPDQPTDRFKEGLPLSFRTFDRLRYAPAIVFRARKDSE